MGVLKRVGASGLLFGAAVAASIFAIAGFIVGFNDSSAANTFCNPPPPQNNVFACMQTQSTANLSYVIGVMSLIIAAILWVMVLKDS